MTPQNKRIYFVYVNFMGKTHPQKWFGSIVNNNTGRPYPEGLLAYSKELTEQEHNLTLNELCQKYPPPKKEENANAS